MSKISNLYLLIHTHSLYSYRIDDINNLCSHYFYNSTFDYRFSLTIL